MEDVEKLLDQESEELTNEELIELEEERVAEEESRETARRGGGARKDVTTKGLEEVLALLNKLLTNLEGMDSNIQ